MKFKYLSILNSIVTNRIIFSFFVLLLLLYHQFGYIGHYGYDDLEYSKLAYNLLNNNIDYNNHFSYRLPLILFTAISYTIFGVSDFASSLPPLIITIFIILLVYYSLKSYGRLYLLIGLSLTLFSNWFLFYSDKLMPDIYVAFSIISSLFILNRYKFNLNPKNTLLYSLLFSSSLFFGFLSKETIILIIPLLIYFCITDLLNKRNFKFWFFSLIFGATFLMLYLFVIGILTNNYFKRFDAIIENGYVNLCSYDIQPTAILLKRLSYEFFNMLFFEKMFTNFIFIFSFLFFRIRNNYCAKDNTFKFYLESSIILILTSNFMSMSLSSYSPMCLDIRHYLFLVPVSSIPASIILVQFFRNKFYFKEVTSVTFILCLITYFLKKDSFYNFYFPLLIVFIIFYFFKSSKFYSYFILAFILILPIPPLQSVLYATRVNYQGQKDIIFTKIFNNDNRFEILTDEVQVRLLEYYSSFNLKRSQSFHNFKDTLNIDFSNKDAVLILNSYTQFLSGINQNDLPFYAKYPEYSGELLFKDKILDISIYKIKKVVLPSLNGKILFSSENDFESIQPNWAQNAENISSSFAHKGYKSYNVLDYSSTFQFQLDSIDYDSFFNILVSTQVHCNVDDKTKSILVISFEKDNEAYFWKVLEINKYIKAYTSWWPINFDFLVKSKEIQTSTTLKVYIWNSDNKKIFIDNFKVEIVGLEE